jgi:hypothetical protein
VKDLHSIVKASKGISTRVVKRVVIAKHGIFRRSRPSNRVATWQGKFSSPLSRVCHSEAMASGSARHSPRSRADWCYFLCPRLPSRARLSSFARCLKVLLGEGCYVERSAKQTTEILHRRGLELEAQVKAMKSTVYLTLRLR